MKCLLIGRAGCTICLRKEFQIDYYYTNNFNAMEYQNNLQPSLANNEED
jgi:hypothetical protein